MIVKSKILNTAMYYIGYCEKSSNYMLDDFTANIGNRNYTKFHRDLHVMNGTAWCAYFIQYLFDYNKHSNLLKGLTGSCSRMLENMQSQIVNNPKSGDLIFFAEYPKRYVFDMKHVGIVFCVDDTYIYTIEGNCGGQVKRKKYKKSNFNGFFVRPKYQYEHMQTLPTKVVKKGVKGKDVEKLQSALNYFGYNLEIDGSCGALTEKAIKDMQSVLGLEIDGSCGAKTRKKLKEVFNYE